MDAGYLAGGGTLVLLTVLWLYTAYRGYTSIRHGQITTIHDPTNTNVVVDAPHEDLRRRFSRRVLDFMAGLRPRLGTAREEADILAQGGS